MYAIFFSQVSGASCGPECEPQKFFNLLEKLTL
jgi:hypothetical protein